MPTLQALCRAGRRPVRVVSQPARPSGRGRQVLQPPVASWARAEGLEVMQPQTVRDAGFLEVLTSLDLATIVVVAFGQIFPRELLSVPARGCINVHASLLPKYRGAAPVQAAIIAGERVTGVTTMLMDEGLDTGPMLLQSEVEIGPEETAGELSERLSILGADLLVETLDRWERGSLEAQAQDHEHATLAPRLKRSDGNIDWHETAASIFNRLRGLTPWPGVGTNLRDQPIKILWGQPIGASSPGSGPAGTFVGLIEGRVAVICGQQTLFGVERLQRPGRKPLPAEVFLRGERLAEGERFG